jgi:O-methyltransferase
VVPTRMSLKDRASFKAKRLYGRCHGIWQSVDFSSPSSARESVRKFWLFYKIRKNTLVNVSRLNTLYNLTKEIDGLRVPGTIVECGVYNGGSAAVMAYASFGARDLYLFDSFQGLPPPGEMDGVEARSRFHDGWCLGDLSKVKELFAELGIPGSRVHIIKGWFQETLPSITVNQVALLHIDVDWYDSVRLSLHKFYDSVQPSGFVVLDDYGRWEGCKRAVDEFIRERKLDVNLTISGHHGHYFQVR